MFRHILLHLRHIVFSDNGSKPYQLLATNTYDNIVASGWSTISITDTSLLANHYYWIGYISATPCIGWSSTAGTTLYSKTTFVYSTFTFPDFAGTNFNSDTRTPLLSGWTSY